ncbi:hypothetical protein [Streptomyces sp. NPDC054838]
MAVASDESLGESTRTFTDLRPGAAVLDRLSFDGARIETGTESHHPLRQAKQQPTK